MQENTIHDSFILKYFISPLSKIVLKILGWKIKDEIIKEYPSKYVLLVVPHTSAWDFFYALLFIFSKKLRIFVMLKSTAVKPLWAKLFLWLGVVPIDRSKANNTVDQIVEHFGKHKKFAIMIPPAGTRSTVEKWKSGFYYIAKGANIPIILGYGDYKRKDLGILSIFNPTGNIEENIKKIQTIYKKKHIVPKHPENYQLV